MRTSPFAALGPRIFPFLILTLVTGFLVLAIYPLRPPAVVPAGSPAGEFSAVRAAAHLEHFAQAPHPTGSAENARVRAYLVAEMAALGLLGFKLKDYGGRDRVVIVRKRAGRGL